MNGLNLANITGLFLGGNEYTKMYYGSNLIWQKGSGPTPPTPSGYNLLDILYSDANGNLSVNSNVLPATDGKTPIGLCVAATGFFGANEPARWMSLKFMNYTTPETGSTSAQGIMMGQYGVDIPDITNINKTYVDGSNYGYFTADWITSGPKIPSLFDVNDNWNTAELGTINAFAVTDIDGKAKTNKWLDTATTQPSWRTDSTITNNSGSGYSPTACCCARYHTLGTTAGDWYLGAGGEMGMIVQLRDDIRIKLQQISAIYPNDCLVIPIFGGNYWTSTEYNNETCYRFSTANGEIYNNRKEQNMYVLAMLNY